MFLAAAAAAMAVAAVAAVVEKQPIKYWIHILMARLYGYPPHRSRRRAAPDDRRGMSFYNSALRSSDPSDGRIRPLKGPLKRPFEGPL